MQGMPIMGIPFLFEELYNISIIKIERGCCLVIVALCSSDDVLEYPIVRDISSRSPKRFFIDMAVRDSLAGYKSVMEAKVPTLRVNVLLDTDDEGVLLHGFTMELVLDGSEILKIKFPDIAKSMIYNEYLSGNLDLYNGRYGYLGSAVWSGRFNMCVKARNLDRKYYVGVTYTGVSLCEPCDTEEPVPTQGMGI